MAVTPAAAAAAAAGLVGLGEDLLGAFQAAVPAAGLAAMLW
jgi:hypothetical protein